MFGIRAVFLLSLVINVLVNGYQDDGNLDGELEVLLKRLQERLEDEERGYELEDLFDRQSMSGIEVDSKVSETYNAMKLRKTYKWATFKLVKNRLVLDKTDVPRGIGEDKDQFAEMKAKLTSEPRYVLFNFNFNSKRLGRVISKIAFILWSDDDNAKISDKMTYASNKDSVKAAFSGISIQFIAERKDDLNYQEYVAEVERKA